MNMKYKSFMSLTDEEIIEGLKASLDEVRKVKDIRRLPKQNMICADICITIFRDGTPLYDEIKLTPDSMDTHDFKITCGEEWKWKQFLFAKGCNKLLENNPFIKEKKIESLSEISISSMNYLFLRAVTNKESFSEVILNEMSTFLHHLSQLETDSSYYAQIRKIIKRELKEGIYFTTPGQFMRELCNFYEYNKELEIATDDFLKIRAFYEPIVFEIAKEWKDEEIERDE